MWARLQGRSFWRTYGPFLKLRIPWDHDFPNALSLNFRRDLRLYSDGSVKCDAVHASHALRSKREKLPSSIPAKLIQAIDSAAQTESHSLSRWPTSIRSWLWKAGLSTRARDRRKTRLSEVTLCIRICFCRYLSWQRTRLPYIRYDYLRSYW